ncbi:MAG: YdeI/OmpD-associated family protein [Chloroflexota bacterium]|nr:YdeI/OmpD-associated family protein [Chloroflexota bacterium]
MATRPPEPMPEDVRLALEERGVRSEYDARPWYQRNDYLAWMRRAKRADTRARRLAQMLDELEQGGVYMRMTHAPSRKA